MIQEFRDSGIWELSDLSLDLIPQLKIINPQRRRKLYV
jgi:hypothetical protein